MKVTRGVKSIKELIPFMNGVFHKNFPKLLPKLYTTEKFKDDHYAVKNGNKVVGTLASIDNTLRVYDDNLKTRGIGMVGVDPKFRGQGIMSSMLKQAISDAKDEGVDFMYLSGIRQRYEYYGFAPAGYRYTLTLTRENFAHMTDKLVFSFAPLTQDSPYLADVLKSFKAKHIRYDRDSFIKVLESWNTKKLFAIFNSKDEVIGHIAYQWGRIIDFSTIEPNNTAYIVKAFAEAYHLKKAVIDLYPNDIKSLNNMSKYAQTVTIDNPACFHILNYRHVIEVCVRAESRRHGLADFDFNIVIRDVDSFNITCKNNVITIGEYDGEKQSFTFNSDEAVIKLFSPSQAPYNGLPFTLPLFVTTCDHI